ncbi:MAG: Uma2 family endonuclease [Alkalinema sp. RU_4_3]|nr:Uma2 family endonuclease [Alkalinema sp. RU_4_3]
MLSDMQTLNLPTNPPVQAMPDDGIEDLTVYPDSDGQPMSDNTKQFDWIVLFKENLEILLATNPDVFVAGDLLWYPIKGDNKTRLAPDTMVAFGRPKGDRGSYQQWKEGNIPPQVVFEVLSPGNRPSEMARKLLFYERFGVEEYYIYDPDRNRLTGYQRGGKHLIEIPTMHNWVSPRLGIRFMHQPGNLEVFAPNGQKFLSPVEIDQRRQQAEQRADRAESAQTQAIPKLQALGLTPEQIADALGLPLDVVQQTIAGQV